MSTKVHYCGDEIEIENKKLNVSLTFEDIYEVRDFFKAVREQNDSDMFISITPYGQEFCNTLTYSNRKVWLSYIRHDEDEDDNTKQFGISLDLLIDDIDYTHLDTFLEHIQDAIDDIECNEEYIKDMQISGNVAQND